MKTPLLHTYFSRPQKIKFRTCSWKGTGQDLSLLCLVIWSKVRHHNRANVQSSSPPSHGILVLCNSPTNIIG